MTVINKQQQQQQQQNIIINMVLVVASVDNAYFVNQLLPIGARALARGQEDPRRWGLGAYQPLFAA